MNSLHDAADVRAYFCCSLIEGLEDRRLFSFSHWSSIGPAIAKVTATAGQVQSASVVNFGTTVYTGPLSVLNTLNRIRANGTPVDSNDGSVYTNPQADGLPVNGTYYEFVVKPSGGTDRNFSFSSPGPMRVLVATGGDVFFTGDHYSNFEPVYIFGKVPTISGFADSPASVAPGTATTLTASSVTESGGVPIMNVKFYRESNGAGGLQTTADTLVGTDTTATGNAYSLSASTTGLSAGTYTFYAVATDEAGVTSTVSSSTLTVTGTGGTTGTPTIGSFAVSPSSVTAGTAATLTASSVIESGGTISGVNFYRESNATAGLQIGSDTLVGAGTLSGGNWTSSAATTGLAAGAYTYYAVATAADAKKSAAASAALTVTAAGGGGGGSTGAMLTWNVAGQTNYGTQGLKATTVAAGVTNSLGLTRGSGVTTSGTAASGAWGGANWQSTSSAGISGSDFVTFGATVASGQTLSLSSVDLNYRRSSSGATSGLWQYQLNAGGWVTIGDFTNEFSSTSSSGAAMPELNLSGITALQNLAAGTAFNLRLTPYGSTSSGGTWYVYDINGKDLVLNGTVKASAAVVKVAALKVSPFGTTAITPAYSLASSSDVLN